jgi:hypothetical protein
MQIVKTPAVGRWWWWVQWTQLHAGATFIAVAGSAHPMQAARVLCDIEGGGNRCKKMASEGILHSTTLFGHDDAEERDRESHCSARNGGMRGFVGMVATGMAPWLCTGCVNTAWCEENTHPELQQRQLKYWVKQEKRGNGGERGGCLERLGNRQPTRGPRSWWTQTQ